MKTEYVTWVLAGAIAVVSSIVAQDALAQGRRLKEIKKPAETQALGSTDAPSLPDTIVCENAVREIVAAFSSGDLEEHLHPDFPNRNEFLIARQQAELNGTTIELRVESIEGMRYTDWQRVDAPPGVTEAIATDCIADVRTRLSYDDPETGERIVKDPGRAEWRVRIVFGRGGEDE